MVRKTKKARKSIRKRGTTNYHGARKKWKSSGHTGGKGMAGTGKRADHKKSLIIKLYGNNYFGKQGVTSRGTERKKNNVMNLWDIESNTDSLLKKHGKDGVIVLEDYKILGSGKLTKKIKIKALSFSESAKSAIEKLGGEVILVKTEEETVEKVKPKVIEKPKEKLKK